MTGDKRRNKVTVLLDDEEFERFQSYCQEHGFKKSTLIARLIRDHLQREAPQPSRGVPPGGPAAGGRE